MTTDENGRLAGWKAIAAYLGKDVRTVLRWERERGVPVHRPPGARGQSVDAIPAELDRWIARPQAQASAQPQQVDAPAQPAAAPPPPIAPPRRWRAIRSAAAWAVGLFTLAGAAAVYADSRRCPELR